MHRGWSIATINSRLGNRVFRVETVPARSAWCPAVSQAGALFALIVVSSAESTAGGMGTRMALAHHHQCNYCGYQLPWFVTRRRHMKICFTARPALPWECGARSDEQEQVATRRIRLQAQWDAGQAV